MTDIIRYPFALVFKSTDDNTIYIRPFSDLKSLLRKRNLWELEDLVIDIHLREENGQHILRFKNLKKSAFEYVYKPCFLEDLDKNIHPLVLETLENSVEEDKFLVSLGRVLESGVFYTFKKEVSKWRRFLIYMELSKPKEHEKTKVLNFYYSLLFENYRRFLRSDFMDHLENVKECILINVPIKIIKP